MVNYLVNDSKLHADWFPFYMLSTAVFAVGCLIFALFADNEPQDLSKQPKLGSKSSMSQAQLQTVGLEELFKMDSISRVTSAPNYRVPNYPAHKQ